MAYLDNVTNILQIQPDGLPTYVRLSQNENGRNLYFELQGNEIDIPSNATVTISGTKPDGTVYSGTGSVTDNVVLIPETVQMTAVAGTWDAKIQITSGGNTIATGRVRFVVDADTVAPGSVPSDSELEGLVAQAQQYAETARTEAYGSPLTASTAASMTDHTRVYVYTGSESGYTAGHWYFWNGSTWTDGGIYNSVAVNTDPTLKLSGVAADAKATGDAIAAVTIPTDKTLSVSDAPADAKVVGDEITSLKGDLNRTEDEIIRTAGVIEELECGLTEEVKTALLACFTRVAWIGDDGQTYYEALSDALNRSRVISGISAVFTQGSATIYDTDELYALKQYLTVTATYSDGTTKEVNNYTLSGKLVAGTSTITVAYNKKTTTFNVTVTHPTKTLESISATFNSSASITTDNVLDDLRPYLTVRASYSDGSTNTITNYALSGSLNVGTNTITVTYNNKTATFTVNVTEAQVVLQSISAVFNQGSAVIYTNSSLNDLKPYLTVTARYSDSTTQTVADYTLSGTLTKGTSTITASYGGKTATFNVTVSERSATLQSITATFTQGSTVIYTDNTLNDLKPYLTVTGEYTDGTTRTITNYTLSGKLNAGTNTITVTYSGKTTTFTVNVVTRTIKSISAVFNQGSAIIYTDNTLNDLKPYLTVTAHYNAGPTKTLTNYRMSGTLNVGTSTIHVEDSTNHSTNFTVNVTERATPPTPVPPSANPIYAITPGTVFNGTSDYIDTELQLLGNNKTNFTIVFDVLDKSMPPNSGANKALFHCMRETSPWPGVCVQTAYADSSNKNINFDINSATAGAGTYVIRIPKASGGVREKFVGIVDFQNQTIRLIADINGVQYVDSNTLPSDIGSTIVSETALIGCYQSSSGTKGRYWTGTVYDLKIYDYAWTEAEAKTYLQEDHSPTLQSITATFNQDSVVIYTDSSLDELKPYLTVTANYSDGTSQTVTNYTLSGTLTKGTSTITVTYSGKTATFTVNVTEAEA